MSNLFQPGATGASGSTSRNETLLKEFDDYAGAQKLVDTLSDKGFDVKHLRIIGNGIRTVEQVTGRMTVGRAALYGAMSGAWFGLLIGLLLSLFTTGSWFTILIAAILLGAGWGMIFGAIGQWASRGRRDFSSVRTMEAASYSVMVDSEQHNEAVRIAGLF